jgi:hypothetical protein
MFTVTTDDDLILLFPTEREARQWINDRACGACTYTLHDPSLNVIVSSSWPVMMVA